MLIAGWGAVSAAPLYFAIFLSLCWLTGNTIKFGSVGGKIYLSAGWVGILKPWREHRVKNDTGQHEECSINALVRQQTCKPSGSDIPYG